MLTKTSLDTALADAMGEQIDQDAIDSEIAQAMVWSSVFTLNEALTVFNKFETESPAQDVRDLFRVGKDMPTHHFMTRQFVENWSQQIVQRKQGMLLKDAIEYHLSR